MRRCKMSKTLNISPENQRREEKPAELCCCTFCGISMHIIVTRQGKRMACCFECVSNKMAEWPPYVLKTEPLPYEVRRLQRQ